MLESNYNTLSIPVNMLPEPEENYDFLDSWLGKTVATAAIIGGGALAYRAGLMKPVLRHAIRTLGNYRRGAFSGVIQGLRNFSNDTEFFTHTKRIQSFAARQKMVFEKLTSDIRASIQQVKENEAASRQAGYINREAPRLIRLIQERNEQLNTAANQRLNENQYKAYSNLMNNVIRNANIVSEEEQKRMMRKTGWRYATIENLEQYAPQFSAWHKGELTQGLAIDNNFKQKVADHNILFNPITKEIADMRDFREAFGEVFDTLADDFTIPFIKINPIRMFYLKSFTQKKTPPIFNLLMENEIQPTIQSNIDPFTNRPGMIGVKNWAFVDGNIYRLNEDGTADIIKDRVRLVDSRGPWARLLAHMSGATRVDFIEYDQQNVFNRARTWVSKVLDIGRQDEFVGDGETRTSGFVWWDLTTYPGAIGHHLHNTFKPYKDVDMSTYVNRDDRYGAGTKWVVLPQMRRGLSVPWGEQIPADESVRLREWRSQWFAGRDNMEDVTTTSLLVYGFFERLNATIGQVGIALGHASTGSAIDIAMGLFTKRLLPLWLGAEAIDYINYTGEQIFGEEPEDMAIDLYTRTQVGLAEMRDKLGLTDIFKRISELTPGHEYLTRIAIPVPTTEGVTPITFADLLPFNQSAEELRTYYKSGEEEVRKGRFWEFGNTPFIGGRIDYYQPNWTRRLTSDWQYTDSLYGSKDEYWANHALPTLQYPLAPIRHFITDPYHWEMKHYEDRPYPMTGDIPEFRDLPLVGPIVSKTLGEVLKPTMIMHPEEWMDNGEIPQKAPEIFAPGQFGIQRYRTIPEDLNLALTARADGSLEVPMDVIYPVDEDNSYSTFGFGIPYEGGPLYPVTIDMISQPANDIPIRTYAYLTPTGMFQVMQESIKPIEEVRHEVEEEGKSIKSVREVSPFSIDDGPGVVIGESVDLGQYGSMKDTLQHTWYNLAELGGFYGFSSNTMFGDGAPDRPQIQRATRMNSYERRFWDLDIGNLGGDANEIFRRFLPHEQRSIEKFNPIRNTMPNWIPGSDYYLDLQHGDPYEKIKKGEMRLPGEAYEMLYKVDNRMDMKLPVSYLGADPIDYVKYWTHQSDYNNGQIPKTKRGEQLVNRIKKELSEDGILTDGPQYFRNESLGISGFADGFVYDNTVKGNEAPLIIRSVSGEEFENLSGVLDKQQSELNFLMSESDSSKGYVMYINRDDTQQTKLLSTSFDGEKYKEDIANLMMAREVVSESKDIQRGDFYDPISRYRILSDVAPYSQEFRDLQKQIRAMPKNEAQMQEIREIREQTAARKDTYRLFTPYKYKTADLDYMTLTVDKILENNMILTEEFPDNPIRLAGVDVPRGKGERAEAARAIISSIAQPGEQITVGITADPVHRINKDTYDSMTGMVYAGPDNNLSETLLNAGLAKERENDYSPASVHARYNWFERTLGSLWETFAHIDTPYHTKFMQARSPLEQYERRDVYGKDWQTWESPVQDFLIPAYQNLINVQGPGEMFAAGLTGGLVGMLFGQTRFGRITGALTGIGITMAGVTYAKTWEAVHGKRWIPERRQEERDLTEYLDALEYVKNRMLYNRYAERALEEEGFDVEQWVQEKREEGEQLKLEREKLEAYKKRLKLGDMEERMRIIRELQELYPDAAISNTDEAIKFINAQLKEMVQARQVEEIPELAATALMYYNRSEQTMYGYDTGEPLSNFISALPRKERDYFNAFLNAPEEEQEEILEIAPDYMRPVLQASWGLPIDPKKPLEQIFAGKELPASNWEGWSPYVSLDDVKIKVVKAAGLPTTEFGIFPQDERRASYSRVRTPSVDAKTTEVDIHNRLRELAQNWGIQNPNITVTKRTDGQINVRANIQKDRHDDVRRELNRNGRDLF